jgi:hypothetical protein
MRRYGNFLENGKETSTSCTTVPLDINMYRKKRKETEKKRRTNGGNGKETLANETTKKPSRNGEETLRKRKRNVSKETEQKRSERFF